MDQLRAPTLAGAVTNVGPAGLKVGAVGAGAYLQPLVATGGPDLNVIGLGRGETHVAGAQAQHPVRQAQQLADLFGVGQELLQFIAGGFRLHQLVHLHLVELVDALDAPGIPSGGGLLATEARRMGNVITRQLVRRDYLITVQTGNGDFRRGYKPQVVFVVMVEIVAELGEVARPFHCFLFDHERES